MASIDNLIVYKRTETLLYRLYPVLKNYPKCERYALCSQIKNCLYNILSNLSTANSIKSLRKQHAQIADGHLQTLKVLIRLSKHLRYIGKGFYEEIDLELTEINKILSGYIRSTSR